MRGSKDDRAHRCEDTHQRERYKKTLTHYQVLVLHFISSPIWQVQSSSFSFSFSIHSATWLYPGADTLSLSNKHKHMHRHTKTCYLPRVKPYLGRPAQTGCKAIIVKGGGGQYTDILACSLLPGCLWPGAPS